METALSPGPTAVLIWLRQALFCSDVGAVSSQPVDQVHQCIKGLVNGQDVALGFLEHAAAHEIQYTLVAPQLTFGLSILPNIGYAPHLRVAHNDSLHASCANSADQPPKSRLVSSSWLPQ